MVPYKRLFLKLRLFFLFVKHKIGFSNIAVSTLVLFIFICIVTFGYLNSTEGNQKLNREALNLVWDYDVDGTAVLTGNYNYSMSNEDNCEFKIKKKGIEGCPDLIYVKANITGIDAIQNRFRMQAQFFPFGMFSDGNFLNGKGILRYQTNISFDDVTIKFNPQQVMSSAQISLSVASGDLNSYPFDTYKSGAFGISGQYVAADGTLKAVNILFSLVGAIQTWKVNVPLLVDASPYRDGTRLVADIIISRSVTTKFFSLFIVLSMWVISALNLILAITVFTRDRKIEPPTIVCSLGMLFALPAIRNSQPGAPPIGCITDTIGFFWNLAFAAAGSK